MAGSRVRSGWFLSLVTLTLFCTPSYAQTAGGSDIDWQDGPSVGQLGDIAQIKIPEGYRFAGQEGVKRFLELTQNPVSGDELGVLISSGGTADEGWFVIFEFNPIGYVKDDEKGKLDADAILTSLKAGNERGNEERRKRGWSTLDLVGWSTPPRYDPVTNNLTWAIRASSEGHDVINHSVRLLGRKGVMDADLVLGPSQVSSAVPEFDTLLTGFEFSAGNRYAEWVKGDRVAAYGLTALVAGGVGAAAVKSGALGKLWKVIVFGALAAVAAIKKVLASVFGSKESTTQATTTAQ
ncbi:MAG: DUF2167 domain-containing protein [Vicinamibacterales bacterium]|jgi:uncharacterized membrane-anchored protein